MKVLDVGSGKNPYEKATHYKDIEPKIKNCIKGDAHCLPFKDNSFDIVVSRSAIEHFQNPYKAIREMIRVAKDRVIVTTPNLTFIGLHIGELFIDRPAHLYGWSLVSFRNFIREVSGNREYEVKCYTKKDINLSGKKWWKWLIELRFLKWIPGRFFQRDLKGVIKNGL